MNFLLWSNIHQWINNSRSVHEESKWGSFWFQLTVLKMKCWTQLVILKHYNSTKYVLHKNRDWKLTWKLILVSSGVIFYSYLLHCHSGRILKGAFGVKWLGCGDGQGTEGRTGSWVHDLSRPAVACHAALGRPFIGSHLQADDIFSFFHLVVGEISPVLLSFPARY